MMDHKNKTYKLRFYIYEHAPPTPPLVVLVGAVRSCGCGSRVCKNLRLRVFWLGGGFGVGEGGVWGWVGFLGLGGALGLGWGF